MPVVWEGLDKMVNLLATCQHRARKGTVLATNKHVKAVFTETQRQVPVDTGALKMTGIFRPMVDETSMPLLEATIEYGDGDPTVDYAVYVHEILWHQHAVPTKAKYVEQPVMSTWSLWELSLGNAIELELRKGTFVP